MRCEILPSFDRLSATDLAAYAHLHASVYPQGGGVFAHPAWLPVFAQHFLAENALWIFWVTDGDAAIAAWPLYLDSRSVSSIRRRELRAVGFAGLAGESVLCAPGREREAAEALAQKLAAESGWDCLVATTQLPEFATVMIAQLELRAVRAEWSEVAGQPHVSVTKAAVPPSADTYEAASDLVAALGRLQTLKRKQLDANDLGTSTAYPTRAQHFLEAILPALVGRGEARVGVLAGGDRPASAADVVVYDGARHVQVLAGSDPSEAGAHEQLSLRSVALSAQLGATSFVFAEERSLSAAQPETHKRLRVWNHTPVGRIERGVRGVKAAVRSLDKWQRSSPLRRAEEAAKKAVQRVAVYRTFHLYRGELYARGYHGPQDRQLRVWTQTEFFAFAPLERQRFCRALDLEEATVSRRLQRGDLIAVALGPGERPVGIAFAATRDAFAAEIDRNVKLAERECYVYDVFVHPEERGQKIAPALLDSLSVALRGRDFYRGWALLERSNEASVHAFEKCGYAPVTDVVAVQTGFGSHIFVRPPVPEARAFLGV